MFRRILLVLFVALALSTVAAQAQPPAFEDLLFHRMILPDREAVQISARLMLPPPPPNGWSTAQYEQVRVQAAIDYFVSHKYLVTGNFSWTVSQDEDGNNILVISGPGINIIIYLPGPFLPGPVFDPYLREQVMVSHLVRLIY